MPFHAGSADILSTLRAVVSENNVTQSLSTVNASRGHMLSVEVCTSINVAKALVYSILDKVRMTFLVCLAHTVPGNVTD